MHGPQKRRCFPGKMVTRQHVISGRPRVVGLLRFRTGHAVAMFLRARLLAVHTRRHAQHRLILFARAPLSTTSTPLLIQPQTRGLLISAVVGCGGSAALYYSRCSCETSSPTSTWNVSIVESRDTDGRGCRRVVMAIQA